MSRPGVSVSDLRFASVSGCAIEARLFHPVAEGRDATDTRPEIDTLVVLAHGFLRHQRRMHDLAGRIAASGIPVATLSFCTSKPWRGGHAENARDMRALADRLDAPRVIYAGFSAGGLSALLAASADPRSLGVVGLDLVDDGSGTAARLAAGLEVPLIGLMGEPAPCNAQANGLAVFAASPLARVETIPGASHCDFESPTDWLCERVCAPGDAGTAARRERILSEVTAAVRALAAAPQGLAGLPGTRGS